LSGQVHSIFLGYSILRGARKPLHFTDAVAGEGRSIMYRSLFIAFLAYGSSSAATFTVEDDALVEVPVAISKAVRAIAKSDFVDRAGTICRFVGKRVALDASGGPALDWVVTTADACSWAASAAPVWVVRHGAGRDQVVLFHLTYDLTIGSQASNGLRNIATARATAARREEQLWKFDGVSYQLAINRVR
jgi:hypothetical protein